MATEARVVGNSTIVSTNPATGEVLAELACASPSDVQGAVLRAKQAQPAWEATPVRQRVATLRRFQRLLNERRDQVADLICRQAGGRGTYHRSSGHPGRSRVLHSQRA